MHKSCGSRDDAGVLRQALRADLPRVVDTWVDAFSSDPYLRWIAPADSVWPAFGADWMGFISSLCFERGHTSVGDDVRSPGST